MRGFVHVVEVMIIGLLLFTILSQFSFLPSTTSDWEKAKLKLLGWDMLFSLDASGINWLNRTEIEYKMQQILPENIVYHINISAPPESIAVCTNNEGWTSQRLRGQTLNKEHIQFSITSLTGSCQVVLLVGNHGLTKDAISDFINKGKFVVEARDFSNEFEIDDVQSDIFGLTWSGQNTGNASWAITPKEHEWPIYNYFHAAKNSTGQTWPEPWNFSFASNVSASTDAKSILIFENDAGGLVLTNSTAWLPEKTCDGYDELLQAVVIWAASKNGFSIGSREMVRPVKFVFFKIIDDDFFQPISIELMLGYRY
ncbi:MAG: hypothetical protein QXP39_00645 [Candidatus Aenigmatarchaeota archaeon]